ncbi:MAG: hypothetical protein ACRDZ8_00180 [Acidimicrobiales bacterium]
MTEEGLRVVSWTVPARDLAAALRHLGPADGQVALYGPDGARIVDRASGDAELDDVGIGCTFGRAFGSAREVLWRSEGSRAILVLVSTAEEQNAALELPPCVAEAEEGPPGAPLEESPSWRREAVDRSPGSILILWGRGDQQVSAPDYPPALAASASPELQVEEWYRPTGQIAWLRYLPVSEEA